MEKAEYHLVYNSDLGFQHPKELKKWKILVCIGDVKYDTTREQHRADKLHMFGDFLTSHYHIKWCTYIFHELRLQKNKTKQTKTPKQHT